MRVGARLPSHVREMKKRWFPISPNPFGLNLDLHAKAPKAQRSHDLSEPGEASGKTAGGVMG